MEKLAAKIYGEALFETAREVGKRDAILEEIGQISEVFSQNPDFDRLMRHPGIPRQEKLKALENVFGGRICGELMGFLEIVVQKERFGELPGAFGYFADSVKKLRKIGVAKVTAAAELTEEQKADIKKRLLEITEYVDLELHFDTDASLIGGLVIRIDDRVADSSIRTKMNTMKEQLLKIQLG